MSSDFCGSFGINDKIGFAPSGAITDPLVTATTRIEILAESLTFQDSVVGSRGITGSIDNSVYHLRQGQRLVRGGILFEAGPNQLNPWLKAIVGNTATTSTKSTFDIIPHDITIERDLVCHSYRYCIITSASIKCQGRGESEEDQIMQVELQFMGVEEADASFPAISLPSTEQLFWLMGDATLSVDATEYNLDRFELTVKNKIQPLFRNLLLPGCFRVAGKREIDLALAVPYSPTNETNLFSDPSDPVPVVVTFDSTNLPAAHVAYETIFTMPNAKRVMKRAITRGEGEIPLELTYQAYDTASEVVLEISNTLA